MNQHGPSGKLGYVTVNVAASASPPRKSKARKEKVLWPAEQTRNFLQWCPAESHRLWPAFAFVATSGDRRGANLGLHWSNIDFDEGLSQLITTVTAGRHEIVAAATATSGTSASPQIRYGLKSWTPRAVGPAPSRTTDKSRSAVRPSLDRTPVGVGGGT